MIKPNIDIPEAIIIPRLTLSPRFASDIAPKKEEIEKSTNPISINNFAIPELIRAKF